jgi:hypothetical protein
MTVRRLKTYAGSQGYVYQYYFVGKRPATTPPDSTEYVFDVTPDRTHTYAVSIFLARSVVSAWAEAHGRAPSDSEQYAAVKLRLLRAFDEIANMQSDGRQLQIDSAFLEESLASLRVD